MIEPRTLVDSRISTLMDGFSSFGVDRSDPLEASCQWTFAAPWGLFERLDSNGGENRSSDPTVLVSRTLTNHN